MARITLIVLAAGRSSRFGRPKQLEPVGPTGEAIMDITLQDAFAHGCERAVIVVRPEHRALFSERSKHDGRIGIVVQEEPIGTAHAVLVALGSVEGTVIVANGDDLYGSTSIAKAVHHAKQGQANEHALVTFDLANTLSASGPVNRAVCQLNEPGCLIALEEVTGLQIDDQLMISSLNDRQWAPTKAVSMNLWVFRPTIFPMFLSLFAHHRAEGSITEFMLPNVVQHALSQGHTFRALHTGDHWCGLTYPADADLVRRTLSSDK
jgi:UTP-glucose-1-phosphate uridylyltransferase